MSAQESQRAEIQQRYKFAVDALRSGHDETADKQFREILRLDPKNASAHANLGIIAFHHNDFLQASREFRAALDLQPALWNAAAYLGLSEFSEGNIAAAKPALENAFEHVEDIGLKDQVGIELIAIYKSSNELRPASDVIATLLQDGPDKPANLFLAYRTYSDLAAQMLSKLSKVAPESAEMHQILGQALQSQDDFQGAIAQYRRALELNPHLAAAHFEIGELTLANSSTEPARQTAEQEFQTALSEDPANAECLYMLGEIQWMRSRPEEALAFYDRSLRVRPAFVDAHLAAGKALSAMGRGQEAIGHFSEAVRLDADNEVAHYRLAEAYRKLGRTQDAEHELATFRALRDSHGPLKSLYEQVQGGTIRQQVPAAESPQ